MFLIFCMKLWNCKGRKATEPGFSKKFLVWRYSRKLLQISIGWLVGSLGLVGNAVFSETALRFFLIFCVKLWDCKGRKATEPGFSKKFLVWRYSRKLLQISIGWLVGSLVGWLVTQFFQKRLKWFFGFFAWSYEILKVEKSQSRIFEKNSWFGDFRKKVSKLAQNQTLWYFSQKRL